LAGLDFEGRVRELAKLATEHGHMAEVVELPEGGLAIRHCNCPIQDVAARTGCPARTSSRCTSASWAPSDPVDVDGRGRARLHI